MSEVQILSPRYLKKMTTKRYIVSGVVQGVGFRYFVYRNAVELGIKGYVRNKRDGTVEVVAEGDEEKLEELKKLLYKGPTFSIVDSVREENIEPQGFIDFQITY